MEIMRKCTLIMVKNYKTMAVETKQAAVKLRGADEQVLLGKWLFLGPEAGRRGADASWQVAGGLS